MLAIVGGGWFGCHIAAVLKAKGVPFELYEARDQLFLGASGFNQNRLHLGFHYPRSSITRLQSRVGFGRFLEAYPTLSAPILKNIYAVCRGKSLLDFQTYCDTMASSGLAFRQCSPPECGLQNVDGCIQCDERVILASEARKHFTDLLRGSVLFGRRFLDTSTRATFINCTYQGWNPCRMYSLCFEPCATLTYAARDKEAEQQAITLMDGPFYSIYPYENGLSTLYSVAHSRIGKCDTVARANWTLGKLDKDDIAAIRSIAEQELIDYYPDFHGRYRYEGWYGSVRSCPLDASDARICDVVMQDNTIHVMSGKIDSIFHAEKEVLKCLGF